jgi:hypothetical protein
MTFTLNKIDTKYNFWSPIMPGGYHITLILLIIGSATKINHLDSTRLGQPLVIGSLLWGSG